MYFGQLRPLLEKSYKLYQDQALCGRQEWGQGVDVGGLGTLPQEQQVGGVGQRGCESLQDHHLTQGTWLGHYPSVSGSCNSSFHVQLIL